jgi:hypothetical protein
MYYFFHRKHLFLHDYQNKQRLLPKLHKRIKLYNGNAASFMRGGKVKLSLCLTNYAQRHEGLWESRCIDPRILDLGTSWCVVSFTPRRLNPWYPLDKRLGGPQNRSGRRRENYLPYRDSNSDPSVVQAVASR